MINTIIFDLGSVLLKEDWIELNKEFMDRFNISTLMRSGYGHEIQNVYNDALIGKKNMKDVFGAICTLKKLDNNTDELCRFYKEAYIRNRSINKKVLKLIKELKKSFKLVCLTDTNHLHFETHEEQGILNLFDVKFGSHQLGMRKKDPRTFKIVLNKLKINSEEALFIDDNLKNIESAKSVGINAIQFNNEEQLIRDIKTIIKKR